MQEVLHKSVSADGLAPVDVAESAPYVLAGQAGLISAVVALPVVWLIGAALGEVTAVANLWLGLLPIHCAGLGAALWFLCRGQTVAIFAARLGLTWSERRHWGRAVIRTLIVLYPSNVVLTLAVAGIAGWFGLVPQGSPAMALLMAAGTGPFFWVSAAVTMILIAPVAEEILFRVVFFEALRPYGEGTATVLTALVFALIHQAPVQIPALFALGLVLQRARSVHGTLWAAIALHACYNAVSLGFFFAVRLYLAGLE